MILGHFYNIKPLFSTFRELLLYLDEYRDVVRFRKSLKPSGKKRYYIQDHLHYLGRKLKDRNIFSKVGGPYHYEMTGRPFLLCDLSVKGDFSIYEEFQSTLMNTNSSEGIMAHVFGMIALFLRIDLAEQFREQDFVCSGRDVLFYLLDPSLLTQLRDDLIDAMIPLTSKDEYEFDLINNVRYHPRNRIKFLAKLAFSTEFAFWNLRLHLMQEQDRYLELRKLINKMYHSFEYFCDKWQLSLYDDIKNNEKEQKDIHDDFKSVIQCIFGMCEFCVYADHKKTGIRKISEWIRKHADCLCTVDSNGKLFDILPKDEEEVNNLVDIMANKANKNSVWTGEEAIAQCLQRPRLDTWFHMRGDVMVFDGVSDIYEFCCKLWRLAFDVT